MIQKALTFILVNNCPKWHTNRQTPHKIELNSRESSWDELAFDGKSKKKKKNEVCSRLNFKGFK